MTPPVLHLVFHPSAALDLRRALQTAGRADRVVALNDNLRILQPDLTLLSAPLTYFDQRILDSAVDGDRSGKRVALDIFADFYDDGALATDDLILMSRVYALIDSGRWPPKAPL